MITDERAEEMNQEHEDQNKLQSVNKRIHELKKKINVQKALLSDSEIEMEGLVCLKNKLVNGQ